MQVIQANREERGENKVFAREAEVSPTKEKSSEKKVAVNENVNCASSKQPMKRDINNKESAWFQKLPVKVQLALV